MSNLSELLPSGGGQNLVEFVASGTLPNGKPVILNSDGTVTVVGMSGTAVAESIPAGSEAVFNAAESAFISVSFDPNTAGKFVVAYMDAGNSSYGTAVVGTISGTSITFGSEYVFNTAEVNHTSIAFDPNTTGKFVITYMDYGNSYYGVAIIGTVSGTTISYGSEVVFNSGATQYTSVSFDPNTAGKFVVAYRDQGNSNYGAAIVGTVSGTAITYGSEAIYNSGDTQYISVSFDPNTTNKFVVVYSDYGNSRYGTTVLGTISGTSISFGSEAVFNSSATYHTSVSFDPNTANKFVATYRDGGNSYYGTAIVGTVSGTSISYGSEVLFNSGNTTYTSIAFDPNTANKFVISYTDAGNSYYGTATVGTISGTSTSFGSEYVYNSSGATYYNKLAFDLNTAGKFVVAYEDYSNSEYGTAIVGQIAATVQETNLTSTNLIGITSEATSSGGTAKINTWGGINEALTSLTIASDYYAQDDGTITTATAGQKLGTAISATTINMKDLT